MPLDTEPPALPLPRGCPSGVAPCSDLLQLPLVPFLPKPLIDLFSQKDLVQEAFFFFFEMAKDLFHPPFQMETLRSLGATCLKSASSAQMELAGSAWKAEVVLT